MVQTHVHDKNPVNNLFASIQKHNVDNIPVYMTVFNGEQVTFSHNGKFIKEIYQDSNIFNSHLIDRSLKVQSLRLNLHKIGISNNWMILSAYHVFTSDFHVKDMFHNNQLKYYVTGLAHDELKPVEPILNEFGLKLPTFISSPLPRIWSTSALQNLDRVLSSRGITTDNLIALIETKTNIKFKDYMLYSSLIESYYDDLDMQPPLLIDLSDSKINTDAISRRLPTVGLSLSRDISTYGDQLRKVLAS